MPSQQLSNISISIEASNRTSFEKFWLYFALLGSVTQTDNSIISHMPTLVRNKMYGFWTESNPSIVELAQTYKAKFISENKQNFFALLINVYFRVGNISDITFIITKMACHGEAFDINAVEPGFVQLAKLVKENVPFLQLTASVDKLMNAIVDEVVETAAKTLICGLALTTFAVGHFYSEDARIYTSSYPALGLSIAATGLAFTTIRNTLKSVSNKIEAISNLVKPLLETPRSPTINPIQKSVAYAGVSMFEQLNLSPRDLEGAAKVRRELNTR